MILIIGRLQIHHFTYQISFICTPEISAGGPSGVSQRPVQSITHVPSCGGTRPRSPSCFHSPTTNKGPFHGLFSATFFFEFLFFLLVTLLLKMVPKVPLNAVWCSQACKGCDMLQRENTRYISFVQSWIRHAVGHEFSVNESTVYIKKSVFKQKHT